MTEFIGKDSIKIGSIFGNLVVVKILDNGMYECKCLCNNLEVISGDALIKREFEICSKCNKEIKMKLDSRNRKELYYIWNEFKNLYNKPTKRFKEEIINKGIKFFPSIFDKENGFELFCRWAMIDGHTETGVPTRVYGESSRQCYIKRVNHSKDFDSDNCYWTSSKTDSYYKIPQLNEKRENQNIKATNYYDNEDDEKELEDSELYYGDDEEDFEIDEEDLQRYLEDFKNLHNS